jgi:hypothetical protein
VLHFESTRAYVLEFLPKFSPYEQQSHTKASPLLILFHYEVTPKQIHMRQLNPTFHLMTQLSNLLQIVHITSKSAKTQGDFAHPTNFSLMNQPAMKFVGRLVVVIDVNPSHGFWTARLIKVFGHEGKCTCIYNTHEWIVYIMLFLVVCGTSCGSSWLRRNEFLKMTK